MNNPIAIPLIMTSAGAQPTPASQLRAALVQAISAVVPDFTANLPATLIEDLVSTGTGLIVTMDQGRCDGVNALAPATVSSYILMALGQSLGLPQGISTNTSVLVVFGGTVGYVIPVGFVVSDGTYQYTVMQGTVIGSNGQSGLTFCVATQSGIWTPLANTVTTVITAVSGGYTLTVSNPQAGTPGSSAETVQAYRYRIMLAQGAIGVGIPAYIKSLLYAIPGVIPRMVRIRQTAGTFEIICGGGDPYAVANAIFIGTLHFPMLMGSMNMMLNVVVDLIDVPDIYTITYVNPPSQAVTASIAWNTTMTNFTNVSQVNQIGAVALLDYINGVFVGQPLNLLGLQDAFQDSIADILPRHLLTSFAATVTVNGVAVTPPAGTNIILSDPESYFLATVSGIKVAQG